MTTQHTYKHVIILALDVETKSEALAILNTLGTELRYVKIGLQLFLKYGIPLVETIAHLGYKIFLDLKLHDIPNTVASAIKSLQGLPIEFLTIHCLGGQEMLKKALEAQKIYLPSTTLMGVTVLTSMNMQALQQIGIHALPQAQVIKLIEFSAAVGMQGFICSPLELEPIYATFGSNLTLITPGVRLETDASNDQKRTLTPAQAIRQGATHIVVGRPIIKAADPLGAFKAIVNSIHTSEL